MMRKAICVLLALLMAFSVFGALADDVGKNDKESGKKPAEEVKADEASDTEEEEKEGARAEAGKEAKADSAGEAKADAVKENTDPEEEGSFPALNEQGFLDEGEFVYMNDKEGVWRYCSDTLRVEIHRIIQKKPARTWYEAEILCAEEGDHPHMIANNPESWMRKADYPHKIARRNETVIAVSGDYAHARIQDKAIAGIVIRNGKVYSERTKKHNSSTKWAVLDTLAIWPDGDMKVYYSNELTAQEYLDAGVRDVLAFGPWLIRDGEMNTEALKKYGTSQAQRVAVGMTEKGHYWFMMLEGRITRSKGDGISFLAEKLQEKGCVQAFNLDGGQTACIVFMGHQLCTIKKASGNRASRAQADILGVGVSSLTAAEKDPW